MSDHLICIASFPSSALANIAASRLEAEGIRACLEGEAAAETLWQMGPTISGVRLMVFEDQADKAIAILESVEHSSDDEPTSEEDQDDSDPDGEDSTPAWITRRSEIATRAWRAAIIGLFFVFCIPMLNVYSMYLMVSNGLLSEEPEAPKDWRINATLVVNLVVIAIWSLFVIAMLRNSANQ